MNDVVKVEVQRSGRRFEAEAVLDLAADVQTVWDTITDYGALPRFMPGIRACRVVEREALAGTATNDSWWSRKANSASCSSRSR